MGKSVTALSLFLTVIRGSFQFYGVVERIKAVSVKAVALSEWELIVCDD